MPQILTMEPKYFSLGNSDKNRLVNIIRILFGALCIAVAIFWLIFNTKATGNMGSLWLTIFFLTVFGFYQIWAGFGKADRFLIINRNKITLKKYIFLTPVDVPAAETVKIEFFPLKVNFLLKSGKNIRLRFGTMYYETNEKIIDEISLYAEANNIITEIIEEEL